MDQQDSEHLKIAPEDRFAGFLAGNIYFGKRKDLFQFARQGCREETIAQVIQLDDQNSPNFGRIDRFPAGQIEGQRVAYCVDHAR